MADLNPPSLDPVKMAWNTVASYSSYEEAQAAGGLGGAIAELLGQHEPLPLARVGMQDHFGESGNPNELLEHFKLMKMNLFF